MTCMTQGEQGSRHCASVKVAILGCSGSIGQQALDVCRKHRDKLSVVALSVNNSCDALVRAAREFNVAHVAVADCQCAHEAILDELPKGSTVTFGDEAITELAALDEVDIVLVALVGAIGLGASYASLTAGKTLALANKESLVVGGELLMSLAKEHQILPVDSEHAAIFQCLAGENHPDVYKIWLTASGGPFRGYSREKLMQVSVHDALQHPSWRMGPKITVDSATLMNKGLEVIEAHHLFNVSPASIEVVIHPQSMIHSMVEFADGSVKAQMSTPDMRIPIQYAFSYPKRWHAPCKHVDYRELGSLSFERPDMQTFRCLSLAYAAAQTGGVMPCVLNAANEVANAAFRRGACSFFDIERIVEEVMDATVPEPVCSLQQLNDIDRRSREIAHVKLSGVVR